MDSYETGQLAQVKYAGELSPRQQTPRERLQHKKEVLEQELAAVDAAIAALDKNPEVELVMTLVQRAL